MNYQWDPEKAAKNKMKHGVQFADAVAVFSDDRALTTQDDYMGEERFVTLGLDGFGRLLVVVYTYRGTGIRLISARHATRHEERKYEL